MWTVLGYLYPVEFTRAAFSGDGGVCVGTGKSFTWYLEFVNSNRLLLEFVSYLLTKLLKIFTLDRLKLIYIEANR